MSASNKKKLRKEQSAAALTEKQRKELKEKKQLKTYTLTFAVIMALVVAIVLGVVLSTPISGAIDRGTHAITVGDHKLSTTDFSYFFVDAVSNYRSRVYNTYYSMYGDYWSLFLGFDTSKPLDEQVYDQTEGTTWADYFMDQAIESAKSTYGLYDKAVAENYKLTDDEQKNADSYMDNLKAYASYLNFDSANAYLRATYGDGANAKTFQEYYKVTTLASSYLNAYAESLEYTDEEYRAHEKGSFNNYSSFTYATYQVKVSDYLGTGEKDENNNVTYTDEQKKNALEAAKKDVQKLLDSNATDVLLLNKAIAGLGVNKDKKDVKCTENKNVLYGKVSNDDIQRWVGHADRESGDLTSVEVTTSKTNDDKSKTLETDSFYIVLFLERDDNNTNLIDVRHILVKFKGGTKGENGNTVYSDKEKDAAKKTAQEILDSWKNGETADEDSFAALAKDKSEDTGSKANGGLYEKVYPGYMVENFNDWCFDQARKAGDTGLVETEYGYHVMYFVKSHDITYRNQMIKNELVNEDTTEWHDAITEAVTVTEVNLSRMPTDLTLS